MGRTVFNGVTLWLGMYTITCTLFWYETGSLKTALVMALVGSTLKTVWSIAHKRMTHRKRVSPALLEESAPCVNRAA